MAWKLREENYKLSPNTRAPAYGSSTDFTIRMHHEGKFLDLDKRCYFQGKVNHFDYCNSDEMSMRELDSMSISLGHHKLGDRSVAMRYYYSTGHCDDCNTLNEMIVDNDTLYLENFVDTNRVVGVFVEHLDLEAFRKIRGILREKSSKDDEHRDDFDDHDKDTQEDDSDDCDKNNTNGKNAESSIFDNNLVSESDDSDGQSLGDDSDYSEKLHDSEYDIDDNMFDQNIDTAVEWMGSIWEPNQCMVAPGHFSQISAEPNASEARGDIAYPHIFNSKTDMEDPIFYIGLCFTSTDILRKAIRRHSMKHGRDVRFVKNDLDKVQVECKDEICGWRVFASYKHGEKTMQIKTVNSEHTCCRQGRVSHANSKFLAEKYHTYIRTNPSWPVNSMMTVAQKECQLEFSNYQMYRAKKKGLQQASGTEVEQFARLWDYVEECKNKNPETTIQIKCKHFGPNVVKFKRLYICWGALKKGFLEGCRPVICLDGCHLKGPSGGILLVAVGIDGNNSMFPLAYVVVEKEKTKSWIWFLGLLIDDLSISNSFYYTIMSDKQKGLVDAVERLLPNSEHRFCVIYLYNNFKLSHRGLRLKEMLWKAATTTRVCDFNSVMEQLMKIDYKAFEWLATKPPQNWSKSHFSTWPKCDILLNNLCESFNAMILPARDKPIIVMLEMIRVMLMKRIHQQRDFMLKKVGILCPKIQKLLDETKRRAMAYRVEWNGHEQFEVFGAYQEKFTVHLGQRSCSCKKWDLTGIPCMHAVAGMSYMHYRPEDFVVSFYKKEHYLKAYKHLLNGIEGPESWPKTSLTPLQPPERVKQPGRPKKARKKQPDEQPSGNNPKKLKRRGTHNRCSICKEAGHNKRGCKNSKASIQLQESDNFALHDLRVFTQEGLNSTHSDAIAMSKSSELQKLPVRRKKASSSKMSTTTPPY